MPECDVIQVAEKDNFLLGVGVGWLCLYMGVMDTRLHNQVIMLSHDRGNIYTVSIVSVHKWYNRLLLTKTENKGDAEATEV